MESSAASWKQAWAWACEDVPNVVVMRTPAELLADLPDALKLFPHACLALHYEEEYRGTVLAMQRCEAPYGTAFYVFATLGDVELFNEHFPRDEKDTMVYYGDEEDVAVEWRWPAARRECLSAQDPSGTHKTLHYIRAWMRARVDDHLAEAQADAAASMADKHRSAFQLDAMRDALP